MIKVGIVGFSFMGRVHFKCYEKLENVKLAAICDVDENKFKIATGTAGNIEGAEEPLDLTGIVLYTDFDKMLAETELDAVSIALPTYLHAEYTIKALEAGLDVLCEKPMALDTRQCDDMIVAAKRSEKILQIGHCIRFWPEYVKTKEIIDSGRYGKLKAATFQRLSGTPLWPQDNWFLDSARSGGAILDLHIHDTDFVQYVFGIPKTVFSQGAKGPSGGYDYIITQYFYGDDRVITAEGTWMMAPGFGFEMSFNIILDKATIVFDITREPVFKVCPIEGEAFTPEVEQGDGYSVEIAHFLKAVAGETVPQITTLEQSRESVKIIEAEKQSAQSGNKVLLL